MLSGFFTGIDPADFVVAQAWFGAPVNMIAAHTGRASWADWQGSIGWEINNISDIDAMPRWSIPLFANQGNLSDAANHAYDSYYVSAATKLVQAYGTSEPIIVRMGEEFNGNWMPWAAAGKEALFAQAYRNFVDAFRSVGGNFKFEWNVANGQTSTDVAKAYPGDGYVDYIGMDFYWDSQQSWSITDPFKAFAHIRDTSYGLQWLENFAAAHGKQSAYSEWGINSPAAGPFLNAVKQWFDSHNVAYQIYWDSNSSFAGRLDNGQYGAVGDMFKTLFGGASSKGVLSQLAVTHFQLDGTEAADRIAPGKADLSYVVNGSGSDDQLILGKGNNYLMGGGGADNISAGDGNNHVYGNMLGGGQGASDGSDLIRVGSGNNYVNGNAGSDTIVAGNTSSSGSNRLYGGQGDDIITAHGRGANVINGNLGADQIDARDTTGSNLLRGGQGNDTIFGGAGNDIISADLGDDVVHISGAGGHLSVVSGGAGSDIFDFSAYGAGSSKSVGGERFYQEISDFAHGADRIDLSFALQANRFVDDSHAPYANVGTALAHAQQLLGGNADAVVTRVGADSYVAYHDGGTVGVIKLAGIGDTGLTISDFI